MIVHHVKNRRRESIRMTGSTSKVLMPLPHDIQDLGSVVEGIANRPSCLPDRKPSNAIVLLDSFLSKDDEGRGNGEDTAERPDVGRLCDGPRLLALAV